METKTTPQAPILAAAWQRFAELDAAASARSRSHLALRGWVALLGVLATLCAILIQIYPSGWPEAGYLALRLTLIGAAVLGPVLAAFVNKYYAGGDWPILQEAAEEIRREIYMYRTVLQKSSQRRQRMEGRLADIQRQMFRNLSGTAVLKPYAGSLPPRHRQEDTDSDPGFHDLTGQEYFAFRLESQLNQYVKKANRLERQRKRLQWGTLLAGGAGALLAAWGEPLTLWVALTVVIAAVLTGWHELRSLDATVKGYNKIILELNILHDHWCNLEPEERTQSEYFVMVRSTENILRSQNHEYIRAMLESRGTVEADAADLVEQAIREAQERDMRAREQMERYVTETPEEATQALAQELEIFPGKLTARKESDDMLKEPADGRERISTSGADGTRSRLVDRIKQVADEFDGTEFTKDTPKETLHQKLSKYPTTGDLKG